MQRRQVQAGEGFLRGGQPHGGQVYPLLRDQLLGLGQLCGQPLGRLSWAVLRSVGDLPGAKRGILAHRDRRARH